MTTTKPKKQTANTKHADKEAADILERQTKALHLRKAGVSYRAIGDQLDCSHEQARQDVAAALMLIKDDVAVDAKALRDLEVARLDDWLLRLESKLRTGDDRAINTALRIMERRSKLLGLDAPVKVQEITWRDQAIADIKAGVINYQALVEAFDSDIATDLFRSAGVPVSAR